MSRLPRLDTPGTLHPIMTRSINRCEIVLDDEDRKFFVTRLGMEGIKAESTISKQYEQITIHATHQRRQSFILSYMPS